MITAFGHIESVVIAMKNGATDYLEKPFQHLEKLRITVTRALDEVKARREINRLQGLQEGKYRTSRSSGSRRRRAGCARSITQRRRRARRTRSSSRARAAPARSWSPARIHYAAAPRATSRSSRSTAPRSPRRCSRASSSATRRAPSPAPTAPQKRPASSWPTAARSSSTRSARCRRRLQAKLLRVPAGADVRARRRHRRDIKVDVRVIAATNRDLEAMVEAGEFREDLFYRLNVIPLTHAAAARAARGHPAAGAALPAPSTRDQHLPQGASSAAAASRDCCSAYAWPGNVRELENADRARW